MTKLKVTKRLDFDLKIKRIIHNLRRTKQEQQIKMEKPKVNPNLNVVEIPQPCALQDYAIPSTRDNITSVIRLAVNTNNFKIRLSIIHMIQ